jgi:hypothetical protein
VTDTKFCTGCKHYGKLTEVCVHPVNGVDIVRGSANAAWAWYMRSPSGRCRPEAKLFEKANTLQRILGILR